ncbi:MAG: hypothetical protein Q4P29_00630 [Tissierellia bacterium]|nr:hypothetical protein [Tissierellia bacterium]
MDLFTIIIFWIIISLFRSASKNKNTKNITTQKDINPDNANPFWSFDEKMEDGDIPWREFKIESNEFQKAMEKSLKRKQKTKKRVKKDKWHESLIRKSNERSAKKESLFKEKKFEQSEAERIKAENMAKRLKHVEEERRKAREGFNAHVEYRGESLARMEADYLVDEGIIDNLDVTIEPSENDFYNIDSNFKSNIKKSSIRDAIIAAEILGKPISKRKDKRII